MSTHSIRRWVFQLEVRETPVSPREAMRHLETALAEVTTADGSHPVWQITERGSIVRAMTTYPPNGEIQLGAVATTTLVDYADFHGTATLLTVNFKDNLGWTVPYAKVPANQAVRQKYLEAGLGYAETVFDITIGTLCDNLRRAYGDKAVIGTEQDV